MTVLHAGGQFWPDRRVYENGRLVGWRCQECGRKKPLRCFRVVPSARRKWSKRCRKCEAAVQEQERLFAFRESM